MSNAGYENDKLNFKKTEKRTTSRRNAQNSRRVHKVGVACIKEVHVCVCVCVCVVTCKWNESNVQPADHKFDTMSLQPATPPCHTVR